MTQRFAAPLVAVLRILIGQSKSITLSQGNTSLLGALIVALLAGEGLLRPVKNIGSF